MVVDKPDAGKLKRRSALQGGSSCGVAAWCWHGMGALGRDGLQVRTGLVPEEAAAGCAGVWCGAGRGEASPAAAL